ncbi:hypothetical protein KGMB02408_10130 [Bacteroides faecalis]|uniref:Acyltransferase 3 domain-containing protein n=1 Tax=Bacteroides faecalis TaxID=2447885 RepID=A0A401LR74_9BACE|nr:hypothetical protein KGMB02408_10130 [Bacteroides faecalis]
MKYSTKADKYIGHMQNLVYLICIVHLVFYIFFKEYIPSPLRHPIFPLILVICIIGLPYSILWRSISYGYNALFRH